MYVCELVQEPAGLSSEEGSFYISVLLWTMNHLNDGEETAVGQWQKISRNNSSEHSL